MGRNPLSLAAATEPACGPVAPHVTRRPCPPDAPSPSAVNLAVPTMALASGTTRGVKPGDPNLRKRAGGRPSSMKVSDTRGILGRCKHSRLRPWPLCGTSGVRRIQQHTCLRPSGWFVNIDSSWRSPNEAYGSHRSRIRRAGVLVQRGCADQRAAHRTVAGRGAAAAREGASVVKWAADHTYTTIKEGTNEIVCYSRADQRDRPAFAVQCTSLANLERVAQNRRFRAESTDREGERALVAAAAENGTRVKAEYGSWFRSMNSQDQASAGVHMTIAMPEATAASTGFPDNREQGGAYIMAAGTSEAHLMVP